MFASTLYDQLDTISNQIWLNLVDCFLVEHAILGRVTHSLSSKSIHFISLNIHVSATRRHTNIESPTESKDHTVSRLRQVYMNHI